jgi:oxygen-independent coproporphyrinogen-3 oxidase
MTMQPEIVPVKALYIHIPFCRSICSYCDFYKMVAKDSLKEKYIDYLLKEIQGKQSGFGDLKTIYVGGGTPSSLNLSLLERFLSGLRECVPSEKIEEFTIEANPNDITPDLLEILSKYGVNRISLGVQSFNERKLRVLKRGHSRKDVKKAMLLLKDYGFDNVSVDLIFGVGEEKYRIVRHDINLAIRYGAKHLSPYTLIVEEKTILHKLTSAGKFKEMNPDREARFYSKIQWHLQKKGFSQYEISNFSKPGYECRHNLVYWNNEPYFGLGAGASGYLGNTRYTNVANLDSYFKGIDEKELALSEITTLSKIDQMNEELMLGLRKVEGISLEHFQSKFGIDLILTFPIIEKLLSQGLLSLQSDRLFIPIEKLYLSNEVLVNFV